VEKMQIELNSKYFDGFYESVYLNSDEFIDIETEDTAELQELTGRQDLEVIYEYENINQYMQDVSTEFNNLYIDLILQELPEAIKNHKNFKFEKVAGSNLLISPKYYNYSTDRTFIKVETNLETLNLIKWYTLNKPEAQQYLIDHHTSRDGFISFINNDVEYWKQTPAAEYEEIYIYALFDMFLTLEAGPEAVQELNYETAENVDKYCYVCPELYINNEKTDYYKFKEAAEAAAK